MRPLIGVLPLYNAENQTFWISPLYFSGIEQAGGLPVLLSLQGERDRWEEYIDRFDGFVFTGGQDVDPALYGHEKIPECLPQAPIRDNQEIYMLKRLLNMDKPVLGICRGIQTINVAAGGTLYQDLPTQAPSSVVHSQQKPFDIPHHQVEILQKTMLEGIVGHRHISVNSMHHQAVWDVAPGFVVSALAEDGIVEAIEHPEKKFFLGVQWHPEHMWQDYGSARKIWSAFVAACK